MPLSRLSIKHQLLLIVAIIAFPAVCIIINSGVQQRRTNIEHAKIETQKLAESIVSEQKNLVASTRQLFIALSQLPEVKTRDHAEMRAVLAEILRLSPQYSNIFIAESTGVIWASAVPLTEVISVADRRYFKSALTSGHLSSGEYHMARTSKKPTLNLAYPVKDKSGKVTDVICAGLSFEYYRQVFDMYKLPKGASFALLDHKGIIVARAIEPEKYVGKPSDPVIFQYMLNGPDEETSIGTSAVVGDNRIQTYRKIRLEGESTPYMYVRAGIPTDVVMSEANSDLINNLLIYSISLVVASLLSWIIGKKFIIDRVVVLQRSSQRLADGDLNTRVAHAVSGGEIGQLGQTFDHMAKKLALREQALRESEKNYRDIFNATHDALFVNNECGRITEANRSSEIMFGYTREELLQMSVEDLISGKPPHSFPEALMLIEKALKDGTQEFEWLSRRKSGDLFWSEITITPTSVGGEKQVLAVIRDITERKEMEQMKEAMLASISHEMRTPLTAMLGFLEFVIENQIEACQLREYHTIMFKEAERLNEMITNFLDMQRLKAKLHQNDFEFLDVEQVINEVSAIYDNPGVKHKILVGSCSGLPPIRGDNELLHQALSNLLSNAIKYSPEGSKVEISAGLEDDHVTFLVKDEGVGIPADSLDRVFDTFYRIEDSRRKISGTGLGLALVKEIAEAHGGRAWAESRLGLGSVFFLSVPIANDP